MQLVLIVLLAFHVVPGVFWAGTTFVLARTGGQGAEQLAYPQIGAAAANNPVRLARASQVPYPPIERPVM